MISWNDNIVFASFPCKIKYLGMVKWLYSFNAISAYSHVDLEIILQGSANLKEDQNKAIFDAVHLYLERTLRFS